MSSRVRVLFAIPHLAKGGGAERVMLTLIERLDRRRFEPQLMVLDARLNELADRVPGDVPVIDLGVSRVRHAWRPMRAAIAAARPDVLLSGLGHLNLMIAMLRPWLPRTLAVIGRETAVVTAIHREYRTGALRNLAYRWFYPNLDRVVCQSTDMRDDLVDRLGFPAARTCLIANPVDVERLRARALADDPAASALMAGPPPPPNGRHGLGPHRLSATGTPLELVAVGRLAPQKGFDLLIEAVSLLPAGTCRVVIIGDGPSRAALDAMIAKARLESTVVLAGHQHNPHAFLARADALVLSSRYEGMPNVMLESLAIGTPVIAMPCPGGTREIARRAGGVQLVSAISAAALADAIAGFANRHGREDRDGDASPPTASAIDVTPYRAESIVRAYEDLILESVTGKSR
ncbi:MAG: glycosyltransferase [Lautropia sp.]